MIKAYENAQITGFNAEGGLTVYFITEEGGKRSAQAHPALKVAPLIGKAITIEVSPEHKWKMVSPAPSKEEIEAYEERKARQKELIRKETEDELKFLASF